jgi:hypothetical protein
MSPSLWLLPRAEEPIPSSRPSNLPRRRRDDRDEESRRARSGTATFIELLERAYGDDE